MAMMLLAFVILALSTIVPTLATPLRDEAAVSVASQSDADNNITAITTAQRRIAEGCSFRKHPYLLYPGEITQMAVLFQLNTCSQNVEIQWGMDQGENAPYTDSALTTQLSGDNLRGYTMRNLKAGKKYKYQVLDQIGSFYAAPSSDAANIKFTAIGDTRSDIAVLDSVVTGMRDAYRKGDSSFQSLALHVGDWVVNDSERAWTKEWFKVAPSSKNHRDFLRHVPFMGCRGNHEYGGNVFRKYYPYPQYVGKDFYWSFDYGPMHVAMVDQYVAYRPGSTQHEWLDKDLSQTDKTWKILVLHEPGWAAGPKKNNKDVQRYIQPLCKKHGVQVVFGGHTHNYVLAVVDGVYHVNTSGGGVPMRPTKPGYPNVVHRANGNHHSEVEITGNVFKLTAKAPNGKILHTFTRTAETSTPDAPTTKKPTKAPADAPTGNPPDHPPVDLSCTKVSSGGSSTIVQGGTKFNRGESACFGSNKFGLTEEGRLVYTVGSTVVWEPSKTNQEFAHQLKMQKGGALVAYDAAGSVVWSSNMKQNEKLANPVAGSRLVVTSKGAEVVSPANRNPKTVWKLEIPDIDAPMPPTPKPTKTPVQTQTWTRIFFNDFEGGWQNFKGGGSDAALNTNKRYANSGKKSLRIRDNSDSESSVYSDKFPVSPYTRLKVDFNYYPRSMDSRKEDFWLQYSTDDGAIWITEQKWAKGIDFSNGRWYSDSVEFPTGGASNVRVRFVCDASGDSDYVYIDDVQLSGKP